MVQRQHEKQPNIEVSFLALFEIAPFYHVSEAFIIIFLDLSEVPMFVKQMCS